MLLSPDYYKKLLQDNPLPSSTPVTPQQPQVQPGAVVPDQSAANLGPEPAPQPLLNTSNPAPMLAQSTAPTSPYAGIPALPYYVSNAMGFGLPSPADFEKLSTVDKAAEYAKGFGRAAVHLVAALPAELVRAGATIPVTGIQAAKGLYQGVKSGFNPAVNPAAGEQNVFNIPGVGAVPSWFKTYEDAQKSGMGPLLSGLFTAGKAIGDVTMVAAIAEGIGAATAPRGKIVEGQQISNTAPIQEAILQDQGKTLYAKKLDSVNEYYPVTDTFAKQMGGNKGNIKIKLSPTSDGQTEFSVVRIGKNIKDGQSSDFNGLIEQKLVSQVLDTKGIAATTAETPTILSNFQSLAQEAQKYTTPEEFVKAQEPSSVYRGGSTEIDVSRGTIQGISVSPERSIAENFISPEGGVVSEAFLPPNVKILSEKEVPRDLLLAYKTEALKLANPNNFSKELQNLVLEKQRAIVEYARSKGFDAVEFPFENEIRVIKPGVLKTKSQLIDIYNQTTKNASIPSQINIPSAPVKGFEDRPITPDQIGQLSLIGKVNGIDPAVQGSIINAITGKNAVGDLTNAEFVQSAQAFGLMNKANQFSPTSEFVNRVADQLSPRFSFFRSVQEKTGVPLGDFEIQMENAQRYMKVFTDSQDNLIRQQYGKYWNDPEAGILVRNYIQGDTAAITENPNLSPQAKTDLIKIANERSAWYDSLGETFGVPKEKYLSNYSPHVQNIGGVFQLYKEGTPLPESSSFFAKEKRVGSLTPLIEDERALAGIYNHAGARTKFMGPVIEKGYELNKSIPEAYKGTLKSYIQEKIGYEGQTEEMLNNLATHLNQKFGWNLPPDTARQVTQLLMDTTYAGAMGLNPGTYLRNLISNPVFAFVENGAEFFPQAVKEALSSKGMAEVRAKGFLVEQADPYGTAIANESTKFGDAANNYRQLTSWTMKGQNVTDSFGRAVTYFQTKFQFNKYIDLYNAGKIRWSQLEDSLGFDGLSVVDKNEIRQQLVSGNREAAMEHLARVKIDNTQFPYRRGTMGRAMNGVFGKVAFQFTTWANNYVHMIGRWIKYGQYDKLIRFIGAQSFVYQTMKNQFGLDYSKSLYEQPAYPSASPAVKVAADFYNLLQATKDGSAENIDSSWQDIGRQFSSLGFPGVEANRLINFKKSYSAGPIGPNGTFPVYDTKGRLTRYAPFHEIFWEAMGLPTVSKVEEAKIYQNTLNDQFKEKQAHDDAATLWRQGKYEESVAIQAKYGFTLFQYDMGAAYLPRNQRTYPYLSPTLKAKYAPQIFK